MTWARERAEAAPPAWSWPAADLKAGRGTSRSPFRILEDHLQGGDAADWRLFSEWLLVSKGRRTLEWSRGLRGLLLPDDVDLSDEELAAEIDPAVNTSRRSPPTCGGR